METLAEIFPVILNGLLIILVIALIVLIIKVIRTLKNVDAIVVDVNKKVKSLDGLFNVIDTTTDALSGFSDKCSTIIANAISALLSMRKKNNDKEEEKENE